MSCHPRVIEWATPLQTHLPHLSQPQLKVLALSSLGMILARSCALTAVSARSSMYEGLEIDKSGEPPDILNTGEPSCLGGICRAPILGEESKETIYLGGGQTSEPGRSGGGQRSEPDRPTWDNKANEGTPIQSDRITTRTRFFETSFPKRLPDGRYRLFSLNTIRSLEPAGQLYKQISDAIPDESVSLFRRDSYGRFTEEMPPTEITQNMNLEKERKTLADVFKDVFSTAIYKEKLSHMPKQEETFTSSHISQTQVVQSTSVKPISLEYATEAINELIQTPNFQTEPSVVKIINEESPR